MREQVKKRKRTRLLLNHRVVTLSSLGHSHNLCRHILQREGGQDLNLEESGRKACFSTKWTPNLYREHELRDGTHI